MLRDDKLSLPENWEAVLELTMLQRPIGIKLARTYICSPCRADTHHGVIHNMKAARIYMFYAYIHFQGVPRAPHAYLPILLNDNFEDERNIALHFGTRLLMDCDLMLVCGNRLSEGMYGEAKKAVGRGIPVKVFNEQVYSELCTRLALDGIDPEYPLHENGRLHHALAMGADELAPYWGEDEADKPQPEQDSADCLEATA